MTGARRIRITRFIACSLLAGALICVVLASCAKNPTRPPPRAARNVSPLDSAPAWSPDGRLIVFRRRFLSADGPPGLYVVSSMGGPIRYLAPADFFWPEHMRFSPDSRRIVCTYAWVLYIIDIASATYWCPIYATNWAHYPDWSPDGRYILYRRAGFDANTDDWSLDSNGVHYLDLATGRDHQIKADHVLEHGNDVYFGRFTRWSPDGSEFCMLESHVSSEDISLVNRDGTNRRVLATGRVLDYLHWYTRPARGMEGIAYREILSPGGPRYVSRDGKERRRFDHSIEINTAFSPDGEWVVAPDRDPVDPVSVLFVQRIGDVTGASRRQLTSWDPPESLSAAPALLPPPAISLDRLNSSKQ